MIEKSIAKTRLEYTLQGSFEVPETCAICVKPILIMEPILRHKELRKPICQACIKEIKKSK